MILWAHVTVKTEILLLNSFQNFFETEMQLGCVTQVHYSVRSVREPDDQKHFYSTD